jgi:hypothetical protein
LVTLAGWLCAGAGSVCSCGTSAGGEAPAKPGGSFLIPAYAYDRGVDIVTCTAATSSYVDTEPMVGNFRYPSQVEYDIEFPVSDEYALHICYAAHEARPLAVWLDGKELGPGCRTPTGGWNTSQASWEQTCQMSITSGKHTLKLSRDGSFPHVVALRFESASALPAGWKLCRPGANRLPEPPFSPHEVKVPALQLAIRDLVATFGAKFPEGPRYLQRLDELAAKTEQVPDERSGELPELKAALVALRREALLANPLLNFDKLLLVQRGAGSPRLGLPQDWESNSSLPQTGYDDQIAVLSPVGPDGQITTLLKPAGGQFVGDVDLHFSAERLLFSMPGANGSWQVFEIRADGAGLRQLTGQQPDVDSYDACYLPDGQIVFTWSSSTRPAAAARPTASSSGFPGSAGRSSRSLPTA